MPRDSRSEKVAYDGDPDWADVVPLPQDDGGPDGLATIAYSGEYSEAMSYLRAVMAVNEYSHRALDLTAHVISMNPAHYTVWLYRAQLLEELGVDLHEEIEYLNDIALRHIKNYQIWHHRQLIITRLHDPSGEADFLDEMFQRDAKNYHVWSYRQWLVKRFALWNKREMDDTERLLRIDIRNNSAWNHRWFLVFGREGAMDADGNSFKITDETWSREEDFAKDAINLTPQNESPWNYLRGLYHKSRKDITELQDFAEQFAGLAMDKIRSSHALDLLADIYEAQKSQDDARKALDLLANKFDPIRVNYWNYRKTLLASPADTAVA